MQLSNLLTTFTALVAAASAAPALAPRQSTCPPANFNAVTDFSLPAYLGEWYIQAQAPTQYLPESSNFCVKATYTQRSATEINIENYANRNRVNGPATGGPLRGTIRNRAEPSKLTVAPAFIPARFGGPYWVVKTGPLNTQGQYEWALVSGGPPNQSSNGLCVANAGFNFNGNGQGLWIFTRAQVADEALVNELRALAVSLGLDESQMKPVVQAGCLYNN
ncbi:hypothetical protein HDV05_008144 [Chytridiales sp. JEL 0842]|nr:hypothetical protein HDV05_008144 [Chytridiales sp. JEL 0842]